MEKKVVVAMMLVLLMIGQATARIDKCYAACYFDCILNMKHQIPYVPKKFLPCAWQCLKKCIANPGRGSMDLYYCEIGCSLDSCSDNIDDATKMSDCLDNCSNNDCKKKPPNSST